MTGLAIPTGLDRHALITQGMRQSMTAVVAQTAENSGQALNHCFHVVVYVDPREAQSLSDEEVVRRWLAAFPGPLKHDDDPELAERFALAILGNPDRLSQLRKRLGSLNWFMKALNEPIARQANREDDCKQIMSVPVLLLSFSLPCGWLFVAHSLTLYNEKIVRYGFTEGSKKGIY